MLSRNVFQVREDFLFFHTVNRKRIWGVAPFSLVSKPLKTFAFWLTHTKKECTGFKKIRSERQLAAVGKVVEFG